LLAPGAIGGLRLRPHEAGEPVFLGVASGLRKPGKLLGHEPFELIDPERFDFLASAQQGSKSLESRADLSRRVAALSRSFHLLVALFQLLTQLLELAQRAVFGKSGF